MIETHVPGTVMSGSSRQQERSSATARSFPESSGQGMGAPGGIRSARWQPGTADAGSISFSAAAGQQRGAMPVQPAGVRSSKWRPGTVVPVMADSDAVAAARVTAGTGIRHDSWRRNPGGPASRATLDVTAEDATAESDAEVSRIAVGSSAAQAAAAEDHVLMLSEGGEGALPSESRFVGRIPAWPGPQQPELGSAHAAAEHGSEGGSSTDSGGASLPNTTKFVSGRSAWGAQQKLQLGQAANEAVGADSSSTGEAVGQVPVKKQPLARRIDYGDRRPIRKEVSWWATLVLLFYLAAMGWYFHVRVTTTLDMRDRGYSIFILAVELLGVTAVFPYAFINAIHSRPTGSKGLPVDDGVSEPSKKFTVRVLIPCYKEDLGVIEATVHAAMSAHLPPGVTRHLYLCDDGNDTIKKAFLHLEYGHTGRVTYVTGRTRVPGEINGKSANLNNCLRNYIYVQHERHAEEIPLHEVIVVFDADMQAKPEFFCKILEVMLDDDVALCLTPQAFSNVDTATDIFNNSNQQFWEYILPGCDALGFVACTGTNFCLRARAVAKVGWFPTYCITEDYALSMDLKVAGFKGRYLAEYLAVGEAPNELRNLLRQRSRWAKGHWQVFFSRRNPLLQPLPPHLVLLYNNGTWSYLCCVVSTWTFILVPFLSLMFELQPVLFTQQFKIASSAYLIATFMVQNYFQHAGHIRGIWFAQVSTYLLSWTYAKAIINVLLAKINLKPPAGFKATQKSSSSAAAAAQQAPNRMMHAFVDGMSTLTRRISTVGHAMPSISTLTRRMSTAAMEPVLHVNHQRRTSVAAVEPVLHGNHHHHHHQQQQQQQQRHTMAATMVIPARTEEPALPEREADETITDKVFMFFCLMLSLFTIILASHQAFVSRQVSAWLALPVMWATYNAVPPILFFGYLLLSTPALQILCFWMQLVSTISACAAIVCLWFNEVQTYGAAAVEAVASLADAVAT